MPALHLVNLVQGGMPIQFTGHAKRSITCPGFEPRACKEKQSREPQITVKNVKNDSKVYVASRATCLPGLTLTWHRKPWFGWKDGSIATDLGDMT